MNILGDYIFLSHKNLFFERNLNYLRFTKGIKYFLEDVKILKKEITDFINNCKKEENNKGQISPGF